MPTRTYRQDGPVTVLFLHGGGFVLGDLDTHDALCRRLAAATRATVVAVGYRRAPEHPYPAAVDDALAVLDTLEGPVAVAGDSAGAFLAVQVAMRRRAGVVAQLLTCPLGDLRLDQPSTARSGAAAGLDVGELREWAGWWAPGGDVPDPLSEDLTGMPPAVVFTAGGDPLQDGGDAYAARLARFGVPVEHRVEPGLGHNFAQSVHDSPACAAADARWLAAAARALGPS